MNKLFSFLFSALAWFTVAGAFAATEDGSAIESVLNDSETAHLVFTREEEKLARDTYITLSETWGLKVFANISSSEQTHMDALLNMLNVYGLDDPVVNYESNAKQH